MGVAQELAGVGDVLGITIFEAGAGGLFTAPGGAATPGNYVTLPNQAVDNRGNISVPYAGTLRAKGRTAIEVQQAIVDALKDSALKPQAVVSLVDQRSSSYSVLGAVGGAGRFAVSASGERLLDAIARAGGLSGPGNESWVMLEREGRLDIVVNNAYSGGMHGDAVELSEADWDRGMDVGLKAMFRAAKYAVPHMRRTGGGSLINLSSVHGLLVAPGLVIPGLQRAYIDYYLIAGLNDWLWWLIGGVAAIADLL